MSVHCGSRASCASVSAMGSVQLTLKTINSHCQTHRWDVWKIGGIHRRKPNPLRAQRTSSQGEELEPSSDPRSENDDRGEIQRDQIISACISTSAIIGLSGVVLYAASPIFAPAAQADAPLFESFHSASAIVLGTVGPATGLLATCSLAGAVTGTRFLLLKGWPDFQEATNVANRQVLLPLTNNWSDIITVGVIPALAEETLFRWALVPAIYPDWRGVAIAGLVFGALHVNGGRNLAFAAWASVIGCAYGYLYLYTGSLAWTACAHGLANVLSATVWLKTQASPPKQ